MCAPFHRLRCSRPNWLPAPRAGSRSVPRLAKETVARDAVQRQPSTGTIIAWPAYSANTQDLSAGVAGELRRLLRHTCWSPPVSRNACWLSWTKRHSIHNIWRLPAGSSRLGPRYPNRSTTRYCISPDYSSSLARSVSKINRVTASSSSSLELPVNSSALHVRYRCFIVR